MKPQTGSEGEREEVGSGNDCSLDSNLAPCSIVAATTCSLHGTTSWGYIALIFSPAHVFAFKSKNNEPTEKEKKNSPSQLLSNQYDFLRHFESVPGTSKNYLPRLLRVPNFKAFAKRRLKWNVHSKVWGVQKLLMGSAYEPSTFHIHLYVSPVPNAREILR